MREVDLQSNLIAAFEASGGHAFKCSNQYKAGVSDLSMQLPGVEHAYNEVKLVNKPLKSATVQLNLTRQQRVFLNEYVAAGGVGIYTVLMKDGNRWRIHIGHDTTLDKIPVVSFDLCPRWVEPKAIAAMFEAYIMERMNARGR